MPRITISISDQELRGLSLLNHALNKLAHDLDATAKGTAIEDTAQIAFHFGIQELRRIWYRTQLEQHLPTRLTVDP